MLKHVFTINEVKERNITLVKNALIELEPDSSVTKQNIAQKTGLSIATVNTILNTLCDSGEILLIGNSNSTVGRPAKTYKFNKDYSYICCIFPSSYGEQKYIYYAIVDLLGNRLEQQQIHYNKITCKEIEDLLTDLVEKHPKIKTISIGIPGYYDEENVHSCTLTELNGCDILGQLSNSFSCSLFLENNMNAIAYGLQKTDLPNVKSASSLVVISFFEGSGPGSGIILNGDIHTGNDDFAGEIAFLPYKGGSIFDLICQGPKAIIECTSTAIVCYAAILNPSVCILTGENITEDMCTPIYDSCKKYIPPKHLPQIIHIEDYNKYYIEGLYKLALKNIL